MSLIRQVGNDWQPVLDAEFAKPYFSRLSGSVEAAVAGGAEVFPPVDQVYRALELSSLEAVKVVIIGQDPYHGPGQAHGLSFSVQPGIRIPGSLRNIYQELERSLGVAPADHGFLEAWARQGVLLLNSVLTVESGKANAHKGLGWESFTDAVVQAVNGKTRPVVFMLWGAAAQAKGRDIDRVETGGRHVVLETSHPSGLSAYRGFRGCDHFAEANRRLVGSGQTPIDWRLPPSEAL